jgi:hypothetical protein
MAVGACFLPANSYDGLVRIVAEPAEARRVLRVSYATACRISNREGSIRNACKFCGINESCSPNRADTDILNPQ